MKIGATILTLAAVAFLSACSGKPDMTKRETTTTTTTYVPQPPQPDTVIEQNKTTTRVIPAE
jgi:starvation-inducible outer membrane lipoprotein